MAKVRVEAVLDRAASWPEDRLQELAELTLEIDAEPTGGGCDATANIRELERISVSCEVVHTGPSSDLLCCSETVLQATYGRRARPSDANTPQSNLAK
jgi:hypothetical protein